MLKEIRGDGNCLFRALAHCIYGTEEVHMKMRQLLVDFAKDNTEVLSPYVLSGTIDSHLAHMKYDRIWGTQVELKAAASLFQMDLYVFTNCIGRLAGSDSTGSEEYQWMKYSPLDAEKLVFPPEEERPRSLDMIHHLELCHSSYHFDCVVDSASTLPLEAPSLQGLIQADVVLV